MMQRQTYLQLFQPHLAAIERALIGYLPVSNPPEILWKAMAHGVLNGGKRIRPVILLEVCQAAGGKLQSALPAACALELVHCYSLIHDDLPCMDDDDLRRGQPTVHKAYGEAMAVLAGDALNAMAFGLLADENTELAVDVRLRLVSRLSALASTQGLVSGQVNDMIWTNQPPSAERLLQIHKGKTAALFQFATWAGGLIAGVNSTVLEQLDSLGYELGLVFQIVDDLLDVESTDAVLGKTAGKDVEQNKLTFPRVYGLEGAKCQREEALNRVYLALDALAPHLKVDTLRQLVAFVVSRES